MNWEKIEKLAQIEELKTLSKEKPVLIFKHSTRCSISSMALDRLSRNWKDSDSEIIKPYYLDLISYRQVSDEIANEFGVMHQSPQVILIKDGRATYDNSHMGISYGDILAEAK